MGLFQKRGRISLPLNKTSKEMIVEVCETIDAASLQIELVKKEYEEVNRYLQDAQIIATLPEDVGEGLMESAKHILALRRDIAELNKKRNDMTEFQFSLMERYEKEIPSEIKRLKREEEYKKIIQGDLRKLAGEKGVLLHEEEEEREKKKFLTRVGILSGFMISVLLLMYLIFYLIFETFLEIPFLATIIGGLILTFYIFLESDRNKKAIQWNVAKMNKLTALTNKIKIKYVNHTAALDYSHDKFAINGVIELEERYEKYLQIKEEEMKKKKTSATYEMYKEKFKDLLEEFHVHDTEVWTFQAGAIIDKKEMVEIRHRLNDRRGKLRDRLSFNAGIVEEGVEKLREILEKYPEDRRMIYEVAEVYKIKL